MGLEQTLATEVAQMLVVRASGHLFDHQIQYPAWEPPNATLTHWVQDLNVGGVILLGGSAAEVGLRTQQLQDLASTPLLLAADIEEGVGQRFVGATWFPPPMAIASIAHQNLDKAIAYAQAMGSATAQEALAIGLNWVLAPVVDVNNNPQNPVINVRAFGEDSATVSALITAFIAGTKPFPVLTSAKHFPGHGDTATDSHLELPVIPHDLERLRAIELKPFQAAIAAGVDTVMSAHLHIPALDPTAPATLSAHILTGLLRQTLGFDGLITTDALVMGAIANSYGPNEAAVRAVEAGADILLMPADPEGAIQALCHAVETGRLSRDRIQASLDRIRWAKQGIGSPHADSGTAASHAWENVPPPPIQLGQLAQADSRQTAMAILKDSMQVKMPHPLRAVEAGQTLILIDSGLDCDFLSRNAGAIAIPKAHGYDHLTLWDQHTPSGSSPVDPAQRPTLLQLFVRGNPFRGSAGLSDRALTVIEALVQDQTLAAVVLYGSPYLWQTLESKLPDDIPRIFSYGQMPDAQTLAMEQLFGTA